MACLSDHEKAICAQYAGSLKGVVHMYSMIFLTPFSTSDQQLGSITFIRSKLERLLATPDSKESIQMCLHSLALKEASNALKSRYTEDTLASDLRVLVSSEHYTPTRALARFFHSLLSPEASDDEVWAALLAFAAKARQDLDRSQQNAASAKVISPTQSELNDALQKVYRHWNTKFCGHAKLALQEKLLLYENTTRQYHQNFYAKIIPIIQSSGMGKSRLMDELSKIHLTILFTFRKNGESGFPPGDPEITRFVDKALSWKGNKPQRSQEELMMAHSHALALVLGALRTLSKWLRRQALKANKDVLPQEDIARKWYERMAPRSKDVEISSTGALSDIIATTRSKRRIKFCNQTIHMAEKILQELNEDKEWKAFFMPETDDFEGLESLEYAQKLQQRVNRIIMRLVSIPDADPPRLLLVFDESSRLFDTSGGGHFFPALRRILRVLRQQPIWTFLLSTDSAMDLLAKPSNEEQSQRLVIHQLGRYDPFIALQLDLSMVEKMSSCKGQLLRTPLNGFSTPEHMAMFGRPLWAMYEKCAIHTIHTFALAKLFNSDGSYNPANKDHVFAAMAYRLSLDPTTSVVDSSAKNLARRAVCAHLRVVVQMDLTTGTFETTTPSEPIAVDSLAMMLCLRIVPGGHTYWQASLDTLTCELLKPGNVGKGEKGELYFRTLFILNRDFYLCRQVPGSPQGHMPYSRPFRLLDFLQYMLPEGIYKTVSQMFSRQATRGSARVKQPGLAAPRKLAEVFEGALCNFSHFVCTSQQLVMDSESSANNLELIHGLMMQQAALQCSTDQYLFDFVIPIYLGDPDADFNRQHLSALLVQVKNTKKEHRIDLKGHKNDYRKFFHSGSMEFNRPLLSVLFNCGADTNYFDLADSFNNSVFGFTLGGRDGNAFRLFQTEPGLEMASNNLLQLLPKDPENSLHAQLCRSNKRFNSHTFEGRFRPIVSNLTELENHDDGEPPKKKQVVEKTPKKS